MRVIRSTFFLSLLAIMLSASSWFYVPAPSSTFTDLHSLSEAGGYASATASASLNFETTDNFAFSLFANTAGGAGAILSKNGTTGYDIYPTGGTWYFETQSASGYSYGNFSVPTTGWHHIVVAHPANSNPSTWKAWVDCSPVTFVFGATVAGSIQGTANFNLGGRGGGSANPSYLVDDVVAMNFVPSDAQVTALCNTIKPADVTLQSFYASGVVSYWQFENSGEDKKGLNPLTLSGATYSATVP